MTGKERLALLRDDVCAECHANLTNGKYSRLIGVEYAYGSANRYDGVSEWLCPDCKTRFGRWTGNVLQGGQSEPRFGGKP